MGYNKRNHNSPKPLFFFYRLQWGPEVATQIASVERPFEKSGQRSSWSFTWLSHRQLWILVIEFLLLQLNCSQQHKHVSWEIFKHIVKINSIKTPPGLCSMNVNIFLIFQMEIILYKISKFLFLKIQTSKGLLPANSCVCDSIIVCPNYRIFI